MKVDQTFNNRSVTIPVGDMLELSLAENPTTGFRWTIINAGEPVCELETDSFVPSGRNPGQGGTRSFVFCVRKTGEGKITLRNRRKWGDADSGQGFSLNVRATPPT